MIENYFRTWQKWFDYRGEEERTDFWLFTTITWIVFAAHQVSQNLLAERLIDKGDEVGVFLSGVAMVTVGWWGLSLPPQFSAAWRRMKSTGLSPWVMVLTFVYFLKMDHWSRWLALFAVLVLLSLPKYPEAQETEA